MNYFIKHKRKITSIFFLLYFLRVFCQDFQIQTVPTPTAMELGKFGNIPVSHYTGKANIAIPLCDWKIKGVRMPVQLSYDATGILMNTLPGRTGHNWSLQAGGVITRTINAQADEYVPPVISTNQKPFYCYFKAHSFLKTAMSQPDSIKAVRDSVELTATTSQSDYSPDIFHFSFMGKNGRFFLGDDGLWKVQSDENIEVLFDIDDDANYARPFIENFPYSSLMPQPKTIKGFILRDTNGTRYYFGGNTDAIEYGISATGMSDKEIGTSWYATSWYLTKVEDRSGNTLFSLSYVRGKFIIQLHNSYIDYYIQNYHKSGNIFTDFTYGDSYSVSNQSFPFSVVCSAPVYLSSIQGSDGKGITFNSTDTKIPMRDLYPTQFTNYYDFYYKLGQRVTNYYSLQYYYLQTNEPEIRQYQYKPDSCDRVNHPFEATCLRRLTGMSFSGFSGIKDVDLEYSFNSRMHLTAVTLLAKKNFSYEPGNDTIGRYRLSYYNFDRLPAAYDTNQTDSWDYYSQSSAILQHGDQKVCLPDTVRTKYGMLTRIVYPTGGSTVMEYEQNRFGICMSLDRQTAEVRNGICGGLRLKSISDYEDDGFQHLLSRRTYNYTSVGSSVSSGQLFSEPRHSWINWTIDYGDANTYTKVNFYTISSVVPLRNSLGPHIGYSDVTEIFLDGSRKVWHYTNIADFPDQRPLIKYNTPNNNYAPTPHDRYSECGYKCGKLLSVKAFSNDDRLVRKTEYTYDGDDQANQYVYASNLYLENLSNESATFIHINGCVYKLYYPKYDLSSKTEFTYDDSGQCITDRTEYKRRYRTLATQFQGFNNTAIVRLTDTIKVSRGSDSFTTSLDYPFSSDRQVERQLTISIFSPLRQQKC